MKRQAGILLIFGLCLSFMNATAVMADDAIFVAANGSDKNAGTFDSPFATMERAKEEARRLRDFRTGDVTVYFRGGVYSVREAVVFTPRDSGVEGQRIIYAAYPGETPVIDGGIRVNGWRPYKNGIYRAAVSGVDDTCEFYVGGKRQTRAQTKPIQAFGYNEMRDGIKVMRSDLPEIVTGQDGIHLFNNYNWRIHYMPISEVANWGDFAIVRFKRPYMLDYLYKFNFEQKYDSWVVLQNSLSFLDEPGEWYYDKVEKHIYYLPEEGDDLTAAVIPVAEEAIEIRGDDNGRRVENLTFRGFTFRHFGWTDPNVRGYCSVQATSRVGADGAMSSMTPGAFTVNYAENIDIIENSFQHIANNGINMETHVGHITIKGNLFYSTGAGAISAGHTRHGENQKDDSGVPKHIVISNNVIRSAGLKFWGAPAITLLYSQDCNIVHNDIDGTSYTGISVGWGWSRDVLIQRNNLIGYNRISNINRNLIDGAAIYSLSTNPGSGYVGNYIRYINAPFNSGALYHDEKSSGFDDRFNVVEAERQDYMFFNLNQVNNITIRDNYTNTGSIVNFMPDENVFITDNRVCTDGNWPPEALDIIAFAGLEKEYRFRLADMAKIMSPRPYRPIVRTTSTGDVETRLFMPVDYEVHPDMHTSAYAEENGTVIIDAADFNPGHYVGIDEASASFLGALNNQGWIGEYTSKTALFIGPIYMENYKNKKDGKRPEIGYDIHFSTPGRYYVFVRGRSESRDDCLSILFNDNAAGNVKLPGKAFSFNAMEGSFVIDTPGTHKLSVRSLADEEVYLDRLIISTDKNAIADASTEKGPLASKKLGDFTYADIPEKRGIQSGGGAKRINAALNKPAYSYDSFSGRHTAEMAADGKIETEWVSTYEQANHWWLVDLQQEMQVTEIHVNFRLIADEEGDRRNFEVQGSNDISFKDYEVLAVHGARPTEFSLKWKEVCKGEKPYRYIRLIKTDGGHFAFTEVELYCDTLFNISAGKKVTVSHPSSGNHSASSLTDGRTDTIWAAGRAGAYWAQIDLEQSYKIAGISLVPRMDANLPAARKSFRILVSNDPEFHDYLVAAEVSDTPFPHKQTWNALTDLPGAYRYVRYVKNGDYVSLAEIEVYTIEETADGTLTEASG